MFTETAFGSQATDTPPLVYTITLISFASDIVLIIIIVISDYHQNVYLYVKIIGIPNHYYEHHKQSFIMTISLSWLYHINYDKLCQK